MTVNRFTMTTSASAGKRSITRSPPCQRSSEKSADIDSCRAAGNPISEKKRVFPPMFPGHVSRDGKVYRYFGHVFEDGTCIDGYDELLPGDPDYEETKKFIKAWKRGAKRTRPFADHKYY